MEQQNKVQWIYSSRGNEELEERYDQWAKDYETDLERDYDWQGPARKMRKYWMPVRARALLA